MKNLIENLYTKHKARLEEISLEISEISKFLMEKGGINRNSTSLQDCRMLQLLVLERSPDKILEIGTWIGTTSYAMSLASSEKTKIYTCDVNDEFVDIENSLSEKIKIHPKTHSKNLLKDKYEDLKGISLAWNDAELSLKDSEIIYDLLDDDFIFATHDFYNSSGNYCKGHRAFKNMKKTLCKNNAKIKLYEPDRDWYYTGFENNINGCMAIIIGKK